MSDAGYSQDAPRVQTPLPGPESRRLLDRGRDLLLGVGLAGDYPLPFVAARRDGWFLEDVDGNRYLDWVNGWASAPLGGGHPELVEAAAQAMREYGTECIGGVRARHLWDFAERLVELAPPGLTHVLYDTTGSEMVESAVRVMREAAGPSRPFVLTFYGSFHGGNYGTGAMGPHLGHYNHWVEPFVGGWINAPFPTCYRCPYGMSPETCGTACIGFIEDVILRYKAEPEAIAGVAVEFIEGENGVQIPPADWPGKLSALCEKHGWILFNDEVQEGLGRTGKWFASEHFEGVSCELLALGKGTSGGLVPICYTLASERLSEPASHIYTGGTFAGSPIGCAVGVKLLEIMRRDNVLDNVAELERVAKQKFGAMKEKYEIVGDVRVLGAYMAVEFVEDRDTKAPGFDLAREVVRRMVEKGVAPIWEESYPWFRPTPALNMPPELFALGCDLVEEAIAEVSGERAKGVA
jgi:4-aminobutyrate aminotransferase-like enzyme